MCIDSISCYRHCAKHHTDNDEPNAHGLCYMEFPEEMTFELGLEGTGVETSKRIERTVV